MAVAYDIELAFAGLRKKILGHSPRADINRIRSAFDFAISAHGVQTRRDGTPYISHPVAVAEIAVELGLDEDSIVAALLHDTIEDTPVTYEDISQRFGVQVADIVEGVTKLTRVQYTSKEEEQMENLRKMLIAMGKDIRVILIKIADRLHNMRTMAYQTEDKQKAKSMETMQIYAPIAHRLGMQKIKWELEDSSLVYLDPNGYAEITGVLDSKREQLSTFMKMIELRIRTRLTESNINAAIQCRIKHIYSIYRKMYTQERDLNDIFDICAFRIIVDDIETCYAVLGQIHDMWNFIPLKFKDYISLPKPNMYQSIHTTLIGTEGFPFEVQIRTWDMHHTAEYGIAAHWKYKSGESGLRVGDEEKFAWIRRLLETQKDSDAEEFFHDLKVDMFADEVFVFSPRGDIVSLPAGATPIDFAYSIHSAIGNSMVMVKVNGQIAPIGRELQNGDIVEILTSKNASPSRDWLNMVKSGQARSKIKQWFKKERREENILHGREIFESELKRIGLNMQDITNDDALPHILKKIAVASLDDMFASIGYGGMTATRCANRVRDELARLRTAKTPKTAQDKVAEQIERNQKHETKAVNGVLVEGLSGCLIKFSKCCTPIPGDKIVGFITRGYGVSVHRSDCSNYHNGIMNSSEDGRWIEVAWAAPTDGYQTTLRLSAKDRDGLVMDIATVLNSLCTKVRDLSARDVGNSKAAASITLEVRDLEELRHVMGKLKAIQGVSDVTRVGAVAP